MSENPKINNIYKTPISKVIIADCSADNQEAELLAAHLGIKAVTVGEKASTADDELVLRIDKEGLSLTCGALSLRGDFTKLLPRLKTNSLGGELLVKAAKLKGVEGVPVAVDATAGLGEDSMLLAASGFFVKLYERDPVIAALLRDALRRAEKEPELEEIVSRMELFEESSLEALKKMAAAPPDLVLLDPMFPARQKSGLVKKKFQLLQKLESPCSDGDELMQAAMSAHPRRIVIKRPMKGPYLADIKPNHSIQGKGIRYDCIVLPRN